MKRPLHVAPLLAALLAAGLTTTLAVPFAEANPATGQQLLLPLNKLMSYPGALRLERLRSETSVSVPVSLRMAVRSARLRLYLANSASLVKRRSQLAVLINDRVVGQIPLDGGRQTSAHEIVLPPDVFKPDFNQLTFRVAQHYALDQYEDPLAPELWTEIDTARSAIALDYAHQPFTPRLADLGEIFSPKDPAPRRVALMSPSDALLDEAELRTGAILAQGVALRLRYVPLEVVAPRPRKKPDAAGPAPLAALDPACFPTRDGLLFGSADQLAPLIGASVAAKITGPFLAVYPLPTDPTRLVVVVSGRDQAEVTQAATAFAFLDSLYPDSAEAVVRGLSLPEWSDYAGRNALTPRKTYAFKDLGLPTMTLNGLNQQEASLSFSLPADAWMLESDKLKLRLHFSHGAGLQTNSVINVLVNRQFGDAIPIADARAHVQDGYALELPMRLFRPGENTLTLVPNFLPQGAGPSSQVPADGLPMTIFGDSSLSLPPLAHFTELPNLDLFGRTGFPYTKRPDGAGMRLWVGGGDRATLGAAWTLMGRLSQTTGMPLFRAQASYDPPAPKEDLLIVAPRTALPPLLLDALERKLIDDAEGLPAFLTNQSPEARTLVRFELGAASSDMITAAQLESPFQKLKTATVFSAESPRALAAGIDGFVQPEAWGGLQSARTYWDPHNQRLAWQRSDEHYGLGSLNPLLNLGRLGSKHPLPLAGLVVALVTLLAFGLAFLLRRHLQTEHPHA